MNWLRRLGGVVIMVVQDFGRAGVFLPGVVAATDIRTGRKTVWDYLTKPLNKAREALRER